MSKFVKILLLVVAFVALLVADAAVASSNGYGIPAIVKYLIAFPLLGLLIAVIRGGSKKKED